MRDSAVRVDPSEMPNRAAVRTSSVVGSQGGSVPRSTEASTERAVSGRVLRGGDICRRSVRYGHGGGDRGSHDRGPRGGRPARRAAHRPAARVRHARRRAARRAAPDRRSAQRRQRAAHRGPAARHDRRGRLDRPPAGLRRGLRAHGPGLRPLRHPRPRGRPQAAVHQQALERRRRSLGAVVPVVRAARRLPARPLRPPQGRVRAQRARHEPLQRLPDHRGQLPAQDVARRARARRAGRTSRACSARCAAKGSRTIATRILVDAAPAASLPRSSSAGGGCTRCCGWLRG